MLEELPDDLTLEVLRTARGTFNEMFAQLPPALQPLAVLAECPGLPACFSPAPHSAEAALELDLPVMSVCVDTTQQSSSGDDASGLDAPDGDAEAPDDDAEPINDMSYVAKAQLWLRELQDTKDEDMLTYALRRRAGTTACRLLAKLWSLQSTTITLPQDTRVVFGPGCAAVHLSHITFQGETATLPERPKMP